MAEWPVGADDVHVTDRSDFLEAPRAWQAILAAGLAVLTAAAVTVVVRTTDPASADTHLGAVREAVVQLADGSEHSALEGEFLPVGSTVRTGGAGGAELLTGDRTVYVGRLSTVTVFDGVHQALGRGWAMVDSRRGDRLQLDTAAGAVQTVEGSLSRIEQNDVLRLGVYEGRATLTPIGRSLTATVPGLYQVQVQYGSVAGRITALALRNDSWDRRLAQPLVSADTDLNKLADSLGGADGSAVLTAAPVALRPVAAPAPGVALGEQALSVAVAQAATALPDPTAALDAVRGARGDGGSWGVVAAIVGARVSAVSALLDGALSPVSSPGGTDVFAGGTPSLPGFFRPTPSPSPTSSRPVPRPTPLPSRPPVPPTPTASPPGLVEEVVRTVLRLIPSPTPSAGPALPTVSPLPLPLPPSQLQLPLLRLPQLPLVPQ